MHWSAVIGTLLFALMAAGCSEPTSENRAGDTTTPQNATANVPPPQTAPAVEFQFMWNDAMASGAWVCESNQLHDCVTSSPAAFNRVHSEVIPVGNVSTGNVTLSWNAQSPIMAEMTIGLAHHTPGCDECPRRSLGPEISGTSPLTYLLPSDLFFREGDELYMWVYGSFIQGANGVWTGATDTQPFQVTGAMTIVSDK